MQVTEQVLDDFRLNASARDKLADTRNAHGNEGKLNSREEAIERHENKNPDKAQKKHPVGDPPAAL